MIIATIVEVRGLRTVPLILSTTLLSRHCYLHFTDEESDSSRLSFLHESVPLRSELGFKPRVFVSAVPCFSQKGEMY